MRARRLTVVIGAVAILASLLAAPATSVAASEQFRVFVFTAGTQGQVRNAAVQAIRNAGQANGFGVQANGDPGMFTEESLARFRAVIFLNTTGSPLNAAQRDAFEAYFRDGGGFVGVGSAIETHNGWEFLTEVLGARSTGRTAVQPAQVVVADRVHDASAGLPERWNRSEAWYNFDTNVRGFSHVLATVTESTYTGGTMGFDHPIAWCKDYRGGRSFYTGTGTTAASYQDANFLGHLTGAIGWASGVADPEYSDCGATVLANFQQVKVSAPPNLLEPIGFDVLPDGRVIQTTRGGEVRLHDPEAGTTQVIATIPVYTNSEDGLYGPAIDNDFADNQWVYLYYAPPTVEDVTLSDGSVVTQTTPSNNPATPANEANAPTIAPSLSAWDPYLGYFQLSRFKFVDGPAPTLDLASEQQILRVPNNRGACCHVAGDIDFDVDNDLWLVTGDDTPAGGGNSGGFGPFNDMLVNESHTLTVTGATGGTFTLTFEGQTTSPIQFPLDNAQIEAALEALANVDDVAVSSNVQGVRTIRFDGPLVEQRNVELLVATSSLTGPAPVITIAMATVNGGQGVQVPLEGGQFTTPHVDARRTSQNTNDLRGKLLRITVEDDGSYTIPDGNLFTGAEGGGDKTRPEIYAMGFRNPFRVQIGSDKTAYVTDYSPDSRVYATFRGPTGTGRVEIVREPSNYGWPLCYAPNLPYYRWNFNTTTPLDTPPQTHQCGNPAQGPENTSRWNTGLDFGPPITQPDIWYSYDDNANPPLGTPCLAAYDGSGGTCPQLFPELGVGGVGPHGADNYEYDPDNPSETKFPPYFDGSVILGEFTRDWLREVKLAEDGSILKINQTLNCGAVGGSPTAQTPFECDNPMDLQFADDGALYLLTYGDGFFAANADAGMYRFEYVKGKRAPIARLATDRTSGQEPLTVQFSSEGSRDPDPGDSIRFEWDFDNNGTVDSIDPNPSYTYTQTGQFTAVLTVIDSNEDSASVSTVITVGNTAPTVTITTPVEGGTFAFGENIPFVVTVTDPEDGVIDCARVQVTFVLGHDEHGHAGTTTSGCSGVLTTNADDVSHGGNVFGVIDARYTDLGDGSVPPLETIAQVNVRQKRQEVESVTSQQGTNVANTADTGGGQQRGSLGSGDWIRLNGPFDLTGITGITFRTSGGSGASGTGLVEIHRDAVDGPLVTSVTIAATANATTYASQTFPIPDPGGAHQLYLVFRPVAGGPGNNFFNLNWVEFEGVGIAAP